LTTKLRLITALYFIFLLVASGNNVSAQQPIVRAVLFFSPSCPHCQQVINEDLPPLVEKYQDQLYVVGIDVSQEAGQNLYQATVSKFNVPDNRLGVPTLVVSDKVLVGSFEIPEYFPQIIDEGLAQGGIDWPDIPGLLDVLESQGITSESQSVSSIDEQETSDQIGGLSFMVKFLQDPVANSIAVITIIIMLVSVVVVGYSYIKGPESIFFAFPHWVIPVASIVGLIAAGYLSYIEISQSQAVCGPIGDCNRVQESPYAYIFGVLPVGVLGLAGYLLISVAWVTRTFGNKNFRNPASIAIWIMAWFGIIFSIYLTFLEPFIIGATCAWCITSALVITIIFLASTQPAKDALHRDDTYFEEDISESNENIKNYFEDNTNNIEGEYF